eukprot:GHVQ01030115.1.p1 GENE.GHVQ01030115.1~~GHVQ01030115.1.p1  ORF type:complete len:427 (+),score=42.50 GHVQ01030115.1:460-1740(+)
MMDCQIPNRGWRLISLLHSLFILSTLYSITVMGMHNPDETQRPDKLVLAASSNSESQPPPTPAVVRWSPFTFDDSSNELAVGKEVTADQQHTRGISGKGKEVTADQQHTRGISGKMLDAMSTAYTWMVSSFVSSLMGIAQKMGFFQQRLTGLKPFDNPQIEAARQYLSGHDVWLNHNLMIVMKLHENMMYASECNSDEDPAFDGYDRGANTKNLTEHLLAMTEAMAVIDWLYPDIDEAPNPQKELALNGREFFKWLGKERPFEYGEQQETNLKAFIGEAYAKTCGLNTRESRSTRNACLCSIQSIIEGGQEQLSSKQGDFNRSRLDQIMTSDGITSLIPMVVSQFIARSQVDRPQDSDNALAPEYSAMIEELATSAPNNSSLMERLVSFMDSLDVGDIEDMTQDAPDGLQLIADIRCLQNDLSELN